MTGTHQSSTSLAALLKRAHFHVALLAVILAGFSILVVGFFSLRGYIQNDLQFSARTIAHAVEASLVFGDSRAAEEPLEIIGSSRPISRVEVLDRDGRLFASWQAPAGPLGAVENRLAQLALPGLGEADVRFDDALIGSVHVKGAGRDLLMFIGIGLLSALICLSLTAVLASRMSGRASRHIVAPLRELVEAVAATRDQRAFDQRVEVAQIAELQQLGAGFNALFEELEKWQAQVRNDHASLEYLASHDPLTGLPNRRRFEDALGATLNKPLPPDFSTAVLFMDGDGFKAINDQFGHEAGDEVLRIMARRLRSRVRSTDLVARLGGDEFGVLMTDLDSHFSASGTAEALIATMAQPINLAGGQQVTCTLSIGIALYPQHAKDATGLLRAADMAMYLAKNQGRGAYCFATEPTRHHHQKGSQS
jgi:diguanylate cyclase (GGDEF)-like protein